ncbi:MAG: acylglycerol kinase family protein [Clostridium sp.]
MYYFIVNPNAHGGRGKKIWRKLERQIHKSGIHYEAFQTEAPGDARRMAAELTANMQEPATIVAVGGRRHGQ